MPPAPLGWYLYRYVLKREPEEFEHIRFSVDGSHHQGMKKLKKKDSRTGKKGHLGCNSAYNCNLYKEFTKTSVDGAKNSQGREQMHSTLDKLARSLRQKNYHNTSLAAKGALAHRLQNPKIPPGGPEIVDGVWKTDYTAG